MTLTRTQAAALLLDHGLAPRRALGQNFVVDPNTVWRIARLADVGAGDRVVEIGAGLGSLTLALAATGAAVTAVEVDRHLVPMLRDVVADTDVRVIEGDALTLDWDEVLAGPTAAATGASAAPEPGVVPDRTDDRWVLVANLPYNVATPLVLDLLDGVPAIARMLVMVQREAGERLAADVGDPAYGIPSVKVRYWATARLVGKVSPEVFLPRPRVESALVAITRRDEPATDADPDRLFALVRAGFGQRRKMLRRSLSGLVPPEAFTAAEVRPEARAEELGVEDWGRLAAASPDA
ncbi:16S rRNA (adenine(1518)-N(6)/adenine(1519)-N(6))-dimethyltransferase RsmA [Iamia sp.]|uniref:16S rRNA (adenine(1518)-N(6)/adenine(1519)-N(6))- dimethyltransferase RsmA n=1 Tax=Iamia sp. TaxID=2722710 RepID=UPI002C951BD2|nr:16S rRNA (adenine(1518)-N(6)/adenine(1519)-N(6))-dimethyltransferase RsmA [Iamia sp.]HXH55891.1 16S rRNA (adenine(1518)-N(6)/adenine(1519)-N(6))-dimethyltransferase RsmA [Iamia sp.]